MLYSGWLLNNPYSILISILFINNISINECYISLRNKGLHSKYIGGNLHIGVIDITVLFSKVLKAILYMILYSNQLKIKLK